MTSHVALPRAETDDITTGSMMRVATTDAQRELWTASQLGASASLAFNEAVSISLYGALRLDALQRAVRAVVFRHDALRARVSADGAFLDIAPAAEGANAVEIDIVDLTTQPAAENANVVADHERMLVDTPFDLTTGPLICFALLHTEPEQWQLTIAAHHIVCDGWSFGVIARELGAAYSAELRASDDAPRATLGPVDDLSTFADAIAQEAREPEALLAEQYWVGQFRDEVAPLELPTDHRRPPVRRFEAGRADVLLEAPLVAQLRQQAASGGTTLFVTLLSGFAVLLHRLSGQEEVVVGIPTAGQARLGLPTLVGHCVNLLPLRLQAHGDQSFETLRHEVRRTLFDGLDHQQMTYGALLAQLPLARDASRLPLVNVAFNLDQGLADDALGFRELRASFRSIPRTHENFELFLNAVDDGESITLELQYSAALFEPQTVARWLGNYREVLTSIAASSTQTIGRLPLLTAEDRSLLSQWRTGPVLDLDEQQLVPHRVARVAASRPDATAVLAGDQMRSYATLDRNANSIARVLRERGVRRDTPVGVLLPREVRLPEAFIGVLRAGGAYVPLDPDLPVARLHFVLADAGIVHVVTARQVHDLLPSEHALSVLDLDEDAALLAATSTEPLAPSLDDADAASTSFVIYTSGSTGTPKGCRNTHRGLLNFVCANGADSGPARDDVALALAATSFDASVGEIAMALTAGARLVVVPREIATDGARLAALMDQHDVTYMFATPASFRLLLAAGWTGSARLRLTCGGEAMTADLAASLSTRARAVWNIYGPSETAVWVTRAPMVPVPARITLGRPMANTRLDVLDAHGAPVPIGVAGELWIGGANVGSGYIHRDDLTASSFQSDPIEGAAPALRYRTGDLVRWLPTGQLEFLGRNDDQVKLRGFRIELGEIAARLTERPEVASAIVIVREDTPGDARLVAYLQAAPGCTPLDADLRRHVATVLPAYMVPQAFVTLAAFPLLPSGKVNRRALPIPVDSSTDGSRAFRGPATATEQILAKAWARALRVARVSTDDDFFQLGGHSLLASQVLADLRTRHGLEVPYRLFFEAPTITQLAAAIDERAAAGVPDVRVPVTPRSDRGPAKASLMQRRLYMLEALDPANRMVLSHGAAWRLRGALDADVMEAALRDVIDRHETLRTRFAMRDGTLFQIVEDTVPFTMHRFAVDALPAVEQQSAMLGEFETLRARPFEHDAPPLFRAMLVRVGPTEHVLLTLQHGLIWDGWSFDVFLADVTSAYAARQVGQAPAWDALPVTYSDYSAWQDTHLASPAMAKQVAWWRAHLAGDLPVLELPTDYPRPDHPSYGGGRVQLRFSAAEADQLRRAAQREGSTLFQFLFAAFHVLLHRYSGQQELLVGMPLRNRSSTEVEGLIGPFTNTVTVKSRMAPTDSFAKVLGALKADCVQVLEHQEMPFELLDRRAPVVRALFSMQDARSRPQDLSGCAIEQFALDEHTATNDLMLWTMEYPSSLLVVLSYRSDLFAAETAEVMIAQFKSIAQEAATTPTRTLGAFSLSAGDAVPSPITSAPTLEVVLGSLAESRAVTWDHRGVLASAALAERVTRAAATLTERGLSGGGRVVYRGQRDADYLTLLLAAVSCGAEVVRLATDDSDDYVRSLVRTHQCGLLMADATVADCPVTQMTMAACLARDADAQVSTRGLLATRAVAAVVRPQATGPSLQRVSAAELAAQASGLGTVLMLSATDCVVDLVSAFGDGPPLIALAALLAGSCRVGVDDPLALEGDDIARMLSDAGGTVLVASSSSLRELERVAWAGDPALRVVLVEPLAEERASWLRERVASVHVAESVTDVPGIIALRAATDGARAQLLSTISAKVVDDTGAEMPAIVPGLVQWSDRHDDAAVGFQTPSIRARRTRAGGLELLGDRADDLPLLGGAQSRTRVAACIAAIAGATDATVALQHDTTGATKLVGYLVGRTSVTDAEIRRRARELLPTRAIPTQFVALDALPRTAEQDVAIAELPNPLRRETTATRRLDPESPDERMLASLWCEMLGVTVVKVTDNFFSLGGYSLLCFQLIDKVEARTGRRLNPRTMLFGTLEQLAVEYGASVGASSVNS